MILKILIISYGVVAIEPYMNINLVRACLVKVCVGLTHFQTKEKLLVVMAVPPTWHHSVRSL